MGNGADPDFSDSTTDDWTGSMTDDRTTSNKAALDSRHSSPRRGVILFDGSFVERSAEEGEEEGGEEERKEEREDSDDFKVEIGRRVNAGALVKRGRLTPMAVSVRRGGFKAEMRPTSNWFRVRTTRKTKAGSFPGITSTTSSDWSPSAAHEEEDEEEAGEKRRKAGNSRRRHQGKEKRKKNKKQPEEKDNKDWLPTYWRQKRRELEQKRRMFERREKRKLV